jgi:branched-subunit amino acid ABC-type transport system permease component
VIYLIYAIFGLGSGGIIALIAAGLVVGYRGSGVVNFAQGGIAMYTAYLYYDLRVNGNYFQPVPGLGGGVQIGPSTGLGTVPSFALALATAGVLGILLHLLVLRPLRTAPQLGKVIATIGVLITLQAVVTFRFGATAVAVPSMLPSGHLLSLGHSQVPNDRLFLCALAIVLALVLWAAYSFTRFGLATRGAAENEKAAILLGYSPVFQAAVSWTLAGLLAGAAGILAAPITNLAPSSFSLLIIPALAAALVGGFQSFGIATLTAILIAAAQSELTNLPTRFSWMPSTGLPDALPALIIILVMFVSGRAVPNRATVYNNRLPPVPEARRVVLPGLGLLIAGSVVVAFLPDGYRLASINTIVARSGASPSSC